MELFENLCISDVTVISGVRPSGRAVDNNTVGRKSNGILFICSGEARFWVHNKRKIDVKSGELLFIPKDCKYKMQYTAPSTTFVLINLEIFDKKGTDKKLFKDIDILSKNGQSNRILGIMANLELCGTLQNPAAVFRKKELIYKLFGVIYESDSTLLGHHKYPEIFKGVQLLEQTFLENLPVSDFAKASNISVSLFRSLFGKQYGMSPIQYRNRLRINKATAILSEGSSTVSETAYACGFENIGYFCRYYKKITGKTPRETKLCNF